MSPAQRPYTAYRLLLVLFFSLLSIFTINQYRFGTGNQAITIPFIQVALDPGVFPGDYLVVQRAYFFTHFWNAVAFVVRHLPVSLPVLFFVIYTAAVVASYWGVYRIAMRLFGRIDAAALALFFLMFDFPLLGMRSFLPNYLDTVIVASPLLLFAFYFILRSKPFAAFALIGAAFLVHPLSAVHGFVVVLAAALADLKTIRVIRLLRALAVFVAIVMPTRIWRTRGPESLHMWYADPGWMDLLRLRSAYHVFPFSWPMGQFIGAAALLAVFVLSWRHAPDRRSHRMVVAGSAAVLAMWAAGTLFVEWLPVSIVVQLQLFRSSNFLLTFAMIYYAHYFVCETGTTQRSGPASVGQSVHRSPRLFLAAVPAIGVLSGSRGGPYAWVGFLGFTAALIWLQEARKVRIGAQWTIPLIGAVSLVLAAGAYTLSGGFSIYNTDKPDWVGVQRWARDHTDRADLFIVPLHGGATGFRVESERAIYADWKDGTQMFWNPAFGYEWHRRIKRLGYRDGDAMPGPEWKARFMAIDEEAFREIAREGAAGRRTLLVMFAERAPLQFSMVYREGGYVVYDVQ